MAGCDTAGFGKEIEKVTVLSEKATEDPDAAQQLTDLIKDLQNHKARTVDLRISLTECLMRKAARMIMACAQRAFILTYVTYR